MTETAMFADLVLPVATYRELGIDSSPALDLVPFVALQQPIIHPYAVGSHVRYLHRTRPEDWRRISEKFPVQLTEEYIKKAISDIPKLESAGEVSYLKENGVWLDKNEKVRYRVYMNRKGSRPL
jgi:anaerobic selenocysteine-containing dehydrogenase